MPSFLVREARLVGLSPKRAAAPSTWRSRSEFLSGRDAIVAFLTRKWETELGYRLIKEVWAFSRCQISARFAYEWRNAAGDWFRSHGNEQWRFDANGLMERREASINDIAIRESERLFLWQGDRRPDDYPGLTALGL